jgi:hypothetical protein
MYTNDYGELHPIMYFDSVTSELYVIDRATRTSDEYTIQLNTGTNFSNTHVYFRTDNDGYISTDYYNSSEWAFVDQNGNYIQGNIDTGEQAGNAYFGDDYLMIRNADEDAFYIYSRETGAPITTVTLPASSDWIWPPYNNVVTYYEEAVGGIRTTTVTIGSSSSTSPVIDYDDIESTWNDTEWWDW